MISPTVRALDPVPPVAAVTPAILPPPHFGALLAAVRGRARRAPRSSSGFPVTARTRREPADPGAGLLVRERRGAQVELVAERFVE